MIVAHKEIPIKQGVLYGGFIYALANLLNNKTIVGSELSKYKNRFLSNFYKNELYHKYTDQKANKITFIEQGALIPLYPFGIRDVKEKNLFEFGKMGKNKEGQYKVYFIDLNLTKLRLHQIIVIKPLHTADFIYVVDTLQDSVFKMSETDFFGNYNITGFSTIKHRYNKEIIYREDELTHLI